MGITYHRHLRNRVVMERIPWRRTKWCLLPVVLCLYVVYFVPWNQSPLREESAIVLPDHSSQNEALVQFVGTSIHDIERKISQEEELAKELDINQRIKTLRRVKRPANWSEVLPINSPSRKVAIFDQTVGRMRHFGNVLSKDFKFELTERAAVWNLHYRLSITSDYRSFINLKPFQLVNHIPGIIPVTHKDLLTSFKSGISCVKPAFKLPEEKDEFMKYVKDHPDRQWVQKGKTHRKIKIVDVEDIKAKEKQNYDKHLFYQEFLSDPFLIDNRKFDIGIHALFTSASPLRYYADFGMWNLKFCNHDYHPFDKDDLQKYVEQHNFTHSTLIKSVGKNQLMQNMTAREALYKHLSTQGLDTKRFEQDMVDAFVEVGAVKDAEILKLTEKRAARGLLPRGYKNRNFFEFVRFDVGLDSNLKPWVIEVNMGPDVGGANHSSTHWKKAGLYKAMFHKTYTMEEIKIINKTLGYWRPDGKFKLSSVGLRKWKTRVANVIKSMFILEGVPQSMKGVDETDRVPDAAINVDTEQCSSDCDCSNLECSVCWRCLDKEDKLEMKRAFLEHFRRGDWRRVTPMPFKSQKHAREWRPENDELFQKLTPRTKRSFLWFRLKCLMKSHWCQ